MPLVRPPSISSSAIFDLIFKHTLPRHKPSSSTSIPRRLSPSSYTLLSHSFHVANILPSLGTVKIILPCRLPFLVAFPSLLPSFAIFLLPCDRNLPSHAQHSFFLPCRQRYTFLAVTVLPSPRPILLLPHRQRPSLFTIEGRASFPKTFFLSQPSVLLPTTIYAIYLS